MTNPSGAARRFLQLLLGVVLLAAGGCGKVWNSPYPAGERGKSYVHDSFNSRPKHLDPTQSYVEDEAWFVYSTYEPLYDYHYLKRPYTLIPNTATALPQVTYRDKAGKTLPADTPADRIATSEYEIHIKPGILYQPHPAFARDARGEFRYAWSDEAAIGARTQIGDFEYTGTRELVAADYVYELKRIARPKIESPSLEIFKQIVGMDDLVKALEADVKSGKIDPDGWIDLRKYSLAGVDAPDDHTLRIRIRGKFPQFVYWLAMTFTAPLPWEAERFYALPGMAKRELTLDMWPVGTGPFMLTRNRPLRELLLERNPNYRGDTYPCTGEPGDEASGLLKDCGKRLPMVDGVKFVYEKEAIPFWNKFLQGYYDFYNSSRVAGMASFDSALQFQDGALSLTERMKTQGIGLRTEIEPAIEYFFVNMLDPVLGDGAPTAEGRERARKLRLAVSIALDIEEYLAIVKNGLGVTAQGPIPVGLAGYKEGEAGINPYVFTWAHGRPKRRSLDEARRLLAEAGYPNGRDARTGEPLILYFDGYDTFSRSRLDLIIRQLGRIDVQLVPRLTEWNRFQEKNRKGNFQINFWGWNADYPDPENFLFLFYSKNGKVKYQGENVTNYDNPEYDRLYEQFRGMDVSADRQPIIDRMVELLRHDAPVLGGWNNAAFFLTHQWLHNTKPGKIIHTYRKYLSIDVDQRNALIAEWNRPELWPLALLLAGLAGLAVFAVRNYRRHETRRGRDRGAA